MTHPLLDPEDSILVDHLYRFLDEAIEIDGAAFGYIQLYNPKTDSLEIVVQRGFEAPFLAMFKHVRVFDASVCARAFRLGNSVVIKDLSADPFISQFLLVYEDYGIYAVQSTPILDQDKVVIGMISTHFPRNYHPTKEGMASIEQIALNVASKILEYGLMQKSLLINGNLRSGRFPDRHH
jgi:GAF domain-containing protein